MSKDYSNFESEVFYAGGQLRLMHYSVMRNGVPYTQDWGMRDFAHKCHELAVKAGWWHDMISGEPKPLNVAEKLCLIHSEVSEAMEGDRKDLMDDKLKDRKAIEVELADAVIRIFDLAQKMKLDVPGAAIEKLYFNQTRSDHKMSERLKDNGKKY